MLLVKNAHQPKTTPGVHWKALLLGALSGSCSKEYSVHRSRASTLHRHRKIHQHHRRTHHKRKHIRYRGTALITQPAPMCISLLAQHNCGHTERVYFNQHCQCALIVGPILEADQSCTSRCARSTPTKPAVQLPMTPPETPSSAVGSISVLEEVEPEQDPGGRKNTGQDETLHEALWGHDRRF